MTLRCHLLRDFNEPIPGGRNPRFRGPMPERTDEEGDLRRRLAVRRLLRWLRPPKQRRWVPPRPGLGSGCPPSRGRWPKMRGSTCHGSRARAPGAVSWSATSRRRSWPVHAGVQETDGEPRQPLGRLGGPPTRYGKRRLPRADHHLLETPARWLVGPWPLPIENPFRMASVT